MAVTYAGRIVEAGPARQLFTAPAHPYTKALLDAVPRLRDREARPTAIEGLPPDLAALPTGCPFNPQCPKAMDRCREADPPQLPVAEDAAGWSSERVGNFREHE